MEREDGELHPQHQLHHLRRDPAGDEAGQSLAGALRQSGGLQEPGTEPADSMGASLGGGFAAHLQIWCSMLAAFILALAVRLYFSGESNDSFGRSFSGNVFFCFLHTSSKVCPV